MSPSRVRAVGIVVGIAIILFGIGTFLGGSPSAVQPSTAVAESSTPALASTAAHDSHASDNHVDHHGLADGFAWGENVLEPVRVSEDGSIYEFEINIVETEVEIVSGVTVTAWGFNGRLPGPELRVPAGSWVKVHFTNTHNQPHTIHWHGLATSQKFDGVLPAILPGQTYTYEFYAAEPGTHFYHCHFDTYRHLDMGMYGALVIEPRDGLPYGAVADYTLVLDDWDANVDPNDTPWNPKHNYFLVNGRAHPHVPPIDVPRGEKVLVRLINAGYQNVPMHLHGTHFEVVASDGKPLPAPLRKDTVDVAPGERYDLLLTGDREPGSFPFHSHNIKQVTNDGHYPGGIHLMVNFLE